MKHVVTVTNLFPEKGLEKLNPYCDLRTNQTENSPSASALAKIASESFVMITYLSDKIDSAIIDKASNLKLIANYGAGFNNIDVGYAAKKRIWVTNTPNVLHETTADLTWSMILGVARNIVPADRFTRGNQFRGWSANMYLRGDVHGKTLGVIGCGEIGSAVARRATGFNMKVLYFNRNRMSVKKEKELNAEFVGLKELLKQSDFVTVHVPLTDETNYMIGRDQLSIMKSTAYLIHTARGKVVDDQALVEVLKEKRIAGAALDVYENEPALTEGMTELQNLMLLPHIGSASYATRNKMADLVADNVLDVLQGNPPRCIVPSWVK